HEHGPWSVFLELRGLDSSVPRWLATWRGDGIIARTGSTAMDKAIAATGLPAVELRASKLPHGRPFVGVDNPELGQLVATHLADNGFAHFAVFDLDTETYFEARSSTAGRPVAAIALSMAAEPVRAMMPSPRQVASQRGTEESSPRSSRNTDHGPCSWIQRVTPRSRSRP
ncbi:MAG: hypothetical protein ACKOWG_20280, partial [Planctomycetia bacterium]